MKDGCTARKVSLLMLVIAALELCLSLDLRPWSSVTGESVAQAAQLSRGPAPAQLATKAGGALTHKPVLIQGAALPLFFEANAGQTDPRVRYLGRAPGYTLFLTPGEAVFALRARPRTGRGGSGVRAPETLQRAVVELKYDRARPDAQLRALDQSAAKVNYLIGRDPHRWHGGIPTYLRVSQHRLWPGIDLAYHGNHGQMELDLEVAPGADPGKIGFSLTGADKAEVDSSGALAVSVAGQQLRLLKPALYQVFGGERRALAAAYAVHRAKRRGDARPVYSIGFRLAAYDKRRPLVIDPVVTYNYVSYLGGTVVDIGDAVAVDPASGHIYVSGETDSLDFPISGNAYQKVCNACFNGASTAFVAELDPKVPAGQGAMSLIYATYLGGSGNASNGLGEDAKAIALDTKGNAYVGGYTYSTDFPLVNAFETTCKACSFNGDAFVSKLSADGSELLYSTYLGGSGNPPFGGEDAVDGIAVDANGVIHAAGAALSHDFPVTSNALQSKHVGGIYNGFFSILNPALSGTAQLLYSTYLGALGGETEAVGVALDAAGNAYVQGDTGSPHFPTLNAYQSACTSGGSPAGGSFVAEFKAGTHALAYSTYLCATGITDIGSPMIAVDGAGHVYLTGAAGPGLTTTPNAPQSTGPSGADAFAVELNPARTGSAQLVFSTYIGGTGGGSYGRAIAVHNGQIYVTGGTQSPNFLLSHNALQKTPGNYTVGKAFISVFDPASPTTFGALSFSSYFGGNLSETGAGVGVDALGNFTIVGATSSSNLPTTANALKPTCPTCGGKNAGFNAWIASYHPGPPSLVEGFIYDVVLNFPTRTFPKLNLPLTGATVRLLDGSGAQVAVDTTDATGYYELDAIAPPGTDTVEVTKNATVYSSETNSYSQAPVKQVRTVTVTATAPAILNLNLPVSIVSEAAAHEYALNNLPLFAGLLPAPEHYSTGLIARIIHKFNQ